MTCTPRIENVAARVEEGGAPELLDDIATPSSARAPGFPPPDAPPGYLTHIAIEKVGGVGPWSTRTYLDHQGRHPPSFALTI
jgi:hypothetical protein